MNTVRTPQAPFNYLERDFVRLKRDVHAADERRLRETERIRQIYIPELVIRLHQELYISRRLFPG
jgi:hypothetical protein